MTVACVGAAIALLIVACGASPEEMQPADRVFVGGAVYTMDAAGTRAQALAVAGGRIVVVGDDAGVRRWIGDATEVVELDGRMVLPGFQDCHGRHPAIAPTRDRQEIPGEICRLDPADIGTSGSGTMVDRPGAQIEERPGELP
jgi:hypothetical protein